jgi:hypothetical protein
VIAGAGAVIVEMVDIARILTIRCIVRMLVYVVREANLFIVMAIVMRTILVDALKLTDATRNN